MTLPLTNYHLIDDSNARAIYGAYHPKDWHAVESYLMSNSDWHERLFDEEGGDWREAIAASRKLNIVLNHNERKYQEIVHASSLVIDAYKSAHELDILQILRLNLSEATQLLLHVAGKSSRFGKGNFPEIGVDVMRAASALKKTIACNHKHVCTYLHHSLHL